MKPVDFKILFELIKNSRRSDRQIARAVGLSQLAVTRRRAMLEQSYIDGYTIVPNLGRIGFEVAALTFMKIRSERKTAQEQEATFRKMREWFMKQFGVVAAQEGRGMGWDHVCVSMHRSFTGYAEFSRALENGLSDLLSTSEAFLIDLKLGVAVKPFHFKYLADLKAKNEKKQRCAEGLT